MLDLQRDEYHQRMTARVLTEYGHVYQATMVNDELANIIQQQEILLDFVHDNVLPEYFAKFKHHMATNIASLKMHYGVLFNDL